jgi:hypothetical protein
VFVDFCSLRSFCALRQMPNVVLQMRESVQALGFPKKNCVFFFARVLSIDNVSRRSWVALKNLRYTTIFRNQMTIKNILQKSFPIIFFIFYAQCSNLLFKFLI